MFEREREGSFPFRGEMVGCGLSEPFRSVFLLSPRGEYKDFIADEYFVEGVEDIIEATKGAVEVEPGDEDSLVVVVVLDVSSSAGE